jgi:hypothetical protein
MTASVDLPPAGRAQKSLKLLAFRLKAGRAHA